MTTPSRAALPRFLAVRNFRRFQHYRDRNPVWIKLYTGVVLDLDFIGLPEAAQAQLIKLWIVRAQFGQPLPYDVKLLAGKIAARGKFHLQALIDAGFIVPTDDPDPIETSDEDAGDSASKVASNSASKDASTPVRARARSRGEGEVEKEEPLPPARVRLCSAANLGLAEHPSSPQPIPRVMPNAGSTSEAVASIEAAGIPIEFAESAIFEIAKTHNATDGVQSLKYFVPGIKRRWDQRNAGGDMQRSRPAALPSSDTKHGLTAGEWDRRRGLVMTRKARTVDGDLWWARMEKEAAAAGVKNVYLYAYNHLDEDDTPRATNGGSSKVKSA